MQQVVYDGSFRGFLCAVFDVYLYKFSEASVYKINHQESLFHTTHVVTNTDEKCERVWKGLQKKLSVHALKEVYSAFLSERHQIETVLLQYIQYIFRSSQSVENDFSHPAVFTVKQTAHTVWKEKHQMEAFVRFQKMKDDLFYAIVSPDHNVLPLIAGHFKNRFADQCWLVWDAKRRYGIYYNGANVTEVVVDFNKEAYNGKDIRVLFNESEAEYQYLWKLYLQAANIPARKNVKLQLKHMPRRYWKYLTEKATG